MDLRKNMILLIFVLTGMVLVLLFLNFQKADRSGQRAEVLDALSEHDLFPVRLSRSEVSFFTVGKTSNKTVFYESLDSIVYEADLDGGNKKELARIPGAKEIVFSPDGRKMVASVSERGELKKYHFDLIENKRTILDPRTKAAAFSPDGSRIAYYLYDIDSGESSVQIAGPGNQELNVFKTRVKEPDLSWPEDDMIVFSNFAIDPDGGGFRVLEQTNSPSKSGAMEILEKLGIETSAVQTSALSDYLVYLNAKDKRLYSLKLK